MTRSSAALLAGVAVAALLAYHFNPAAADVAATMPAPPMNHPAIIKVGDSYVNADHITHIYPWKAGNDQHHVLRVEFDTAVATEIDAQDFTGPEEAALRKALDGIAR